MSFLRYPVVQFLVVRLDSGSFNSTGIVNELDHDVDCLFLAERRNPQRLMHYASRHACGLPRATHSGPSVFVIAVTCRQSLF
jgi:hypothetical protein